jgi:hypothetical protein
MPSILRSLRRTTSHHEGVRESEVIAPPLLSPAINWGEWLASRHVRFSPVYRVPNTHWIRGWVDPRNGLDIVNNKFFPLPRMKPRPCSPLPYRLSHPGSGEFNYTKNCLIQTIYHMCCSGIELGPPWWVNTTSNVLRHYIIIHNLRAVPMLLSYGQTRITFTEVQHIYRRSVALYIVSNWYLRNLSSAPTTDLSAFFRNVKDMNLDENSFQVNEIITIKTLNILKSCQNKNCLTLLWDESSHVSITTDFELSRSIRDVQKR